MTTFAAKDATGTPQTLNLADVTAAGTHHLLPCLPFKVMLQELQFQSQFLEVAVEEEMQPQQIKLLET